MHLFIPYLVLAALASTASSLPNLHGPINLKRDDSPNLIPFPTGTDIPAFPDNDLRARQTGAFGTSSPHGTGSHTYYPHHHHTGTGGHHSASVTLAARQFSESASSGGGGFPTSFSISMPTGTGGGFPSITGTSPSMTLLSGSGFGGGAPTGGFGGGGGSQTGHGGGPHSHGSYSQLSSSPTQTSSLINVPRHFSSSPSGGFPSMTIPTGSGFGGGPTGSGGPFPTDSHSSKLGGQASIMANFPRQFPSGPSGGFPMPTGSGTGAPFPFPFPFPTTFQTSVVLPSSSAP